MTSHSMAEAYAHTGAGASSSRTHSNASRGVSSRRAAKRPHMEVQVPTANQASNYPEVARVSRNAFGASTEDGNGEKQDETSKPINQSMDMTSPRLCICQPDPKIPRPRNGESLCSKIIEHNGRHYLPCQSDSTIALCFVARALIERLTNHI